MVTIYKLKLKTFKIIQKIFKIFNFKIFYSKDIDVLSNLKVDMIIDVGVANGTKFLLNNFSNAKYLLIEPNIDYHKNIETKLAKKFNTKLFKYAAGNKNEKKKLFINGPISSFYERENFKFNNFYEVEVRQLDEILINEKISSNSLLKIDCEGGELDVLLGANNTLNKVKYVIVELRLNKIDTYNPSEIINYLYEKKFFWKHILKVYYAKNGIDFLDVIFVKK